MKKEKDYFHNSPYGVFFYWRYPRCGWPCSNEVIRADYTICHERGTKLLEERRLDSGLLEYNIICVPYRGRMSTYRKTESSCHGVKLAQETRHRLGPYITIFVCLLSSQYMKRSEERDGLFTITNVWEVFLPALSTL